MCKAGWFGFRTKEKKTPPDGSKELERIIAGFKIRGGDDASSGQVPYIVSLQDHTRQTPHFCGASIIHPFILLTAAHCLVDMKTPEGITAVSGEHRLSVNEGTEQVRNISRMIVHENWDGAIVNNDIALLVLDQPFEFDSYTRPIRIPVPNAPLSRVANVSGWGYTGRRGNSADVLQRAKVGFKNRTTCEQWFGSANMVITDSMICAGGARDACELDSGGPLVCQSKSGEPYLCGIVSWGIQGCYKSGLPGVYTNVSMYHDWITNHLRGILNNHPAAQQSAKACGAATSFDPDVTCITCALRVNKGGKYKDKTSLPYVASFRIHADIQHRYSRTQVTSVLVNPNDTMSHEVSFSVFLPETAFISHFSMTIEGIEFNACTEGRQIARCKYGNQGNKTAKIVENSSGSGFSVTRQLPPHTIVTVRFAYEGLVPRRAGLYEQSIHIDQTMVRDAKSFEITAAVKDSRNITMLRALGMSSDFEKDIEGANIYRNGSVGTISWRPDAREPHIPQHFVLQYDTAPATGVSSGEILIRDGYFAHFFSPGHVPAAEKHRIFLLQLSSSINSTVLSQLKGAAVHMLSGLDRRDRFSLITFDDTARIVRADVGFGQVRRTKSLIQSLKGNGGSDLHGALMTALNSSLGSSSVKPIVVLFSTGNATTGITDGDTIRSQVAAANLMRKLPICSVGFGSSQDFSFLRKLSRQNNGFARKFHPGLDPPFQQLTEFYTQISSLLPFHLHFTYNTFNSSLTVSHVTATSFPSYFKGDDIVVAGKFLSKAGSNGSELLETDEETGSMSCAPTSEPGLLTATVNGRSTRGLLTLKSSQPLDCKHLLETGADFMERLWAYLTIKETLHKAETMTQNDLLTDTKERGCEEPSKYAQRLALKYGFVTPVTSLVIIHPDAPEEVVESPEMDFLSVRAGVQAVMDVDGQDGKVTTGGGHGAGMEPNLGIQLAPGKHSWSNGSSSFGIGSPCENGLLSNN